MPQGRCEGCAVLCCPRSALSLGLPLSRWKTADPSDLSVKPGSTGDVVSVDPGPAEIGAVVAGFDGKPRSPRADVSSSALVRYVSPGRRLSSTLFLAGSVLATMDFRQNPPRNRPVSVKPGLA